MSGDPHLPPVAGAEAERPGPPAPRPAYEPRQRTWWAWPLRISGQLFVVIWVWKFYGCMQLPMDCTDHTSSDKALVHLVVALMMAFAIEVILLVNRVFDEPAA